jgi:hypothetical protein
VFADPGGLGFARGQKFVGTMRLRLYNEAGRDTARDVEVFVTAHGRAVHDGEAVTLLIADEENLNFDSPIDGGPGRSTATVPSGYSRRVYFAILGSQSGIEAKLSPIMLEPQDGDSGEPWGALAIYPARQAKAMFDASSEYYIEIVVTGSNFDALTYQGTIGFRDDSEEVQEAPVPTVTLQWLEGPNLIEGFTSSGIRGRWLGPLPEGQPA